MLAPNAKAEQAYRAQAQDSGAFAPKFLARTNRENVRDNAEAGQHRHINFRLNEKPEPLLYGKRAREWGNRTLPKEPRAGKTIRHLQRAGSQQYAKNQKA